MSTHMSPIPEIQPLMVIRPAQLGVSSPIVDVQVVSNTALFRHQDSTVTELGRGVLHMVASATDLDGAAQILSNSHQLLVRYHDGRVRMWGEFYQSDVPMPTDLTDVCDIALSFGVAMAVRNNGTVVAWGSNFHGQCTIPVEATNICQVSIGRKHVVARRHDGTVITWGKYYSGAMMMPAHVHDATHVCAHTLNSAALLANGRWAVWGSNALDNGMTTQFPTVTHVALGINSCAVVTPNHELIVWGSIWSNDAIAPVVVASKDSLNTPIPVRRCVVPTDVGQILHVSFGDTIADQAVRDGSMLVLAVTDTGCVVVWGLPATAAQVPTHIPAGSQLIVGKQGWATLLPDGHVRIFLDGDQTPDCKAAYDDMRTQGNIAHMSLRHYPVVLYRDGTLDCYAGRFDQVTQFIQLGTVLACKADGTVINVEPRDDTRIDVTDVCHLSSDEMMYVAAVRRDGTTVLADVYADPPTTIVLDELTDIISADVNEWRSVIGLRRDGGVVVYQGDADASVCEIPSDANDAVQVMTMWNTYLALRRDGRVIAWGQSRLGWCDVPTGLTDVVQLVGTVQGHMVAVRRDGQVVTWGGYWVTDVAHMQQLDLITLR